MSDDTGYLVLNTGEVLEGKWLSTNCKVEGELVFNTAMTGYEEVISDPSNAGQIVTLTYPLIGNYGCNTTYSKSIKPHLAGLIIHKPYMETDATPSQYSLESFIEKYNIPCLFDIDTRCLTTIIRNRGKVFGKITDNQSDIPKIEQLDNKLVSSVSVTKKQSYTQNEKEALHVVMIDFGFKHSILQSLLNSGCNVTVLPYNSTFQDVAQIHRDGIVLSNGPGDPEALKNHLSTIKQIADHFPTLGIGLGHQLLALAYGAKTKRLAVGHRGSNHPVKDLNTGKIFMTSQNHGFVVDKNSINHKNWKITHINVNDQSIEGITHLKKQIMALQFHPEAYLSQNDSHHFLHRFIDMISKKGAKQYA